MWKIQKTVFVAISGGVDSSVAAALLHKQGYRVVGAHMRCFNVDGCAERDAEDARRVAEQLHIPFYTFNLETEYKDRVVEYMVEGYRHGLTPNPDVMCNKEIKFGLFLKRALALGADYMATGHYVRLKGTNAQARTVRYSLMTARDRAKDQSYFLWTLTQAQLQHCLFPLAEYTKPQVRALAHKYGLLTAEKKDSQGICFLGRVPLTHFLKNYIPERRGAVVTTAGKTIGEHEGAHLYTVGQRHGLKIGGFVQPLYIADKDIQNNTVTIAEGKNNPALYKKEIMLTGIHYINPLPEIKPLKSKVLVRVRYREPLTQGTLERLASGHGKLIFNHPQKCIAPGQSAVFYTKQGEMLGGGVIA